MTMIIIRPAFIQPRHAAGWIIQMRMPTSSCYWGGNPARTPQAASAAYESAIRQAFPLDTIVVKSATRAHLAKAARLQA